MKKIIEERKEQAQGFLSTLETQISQVEERLQQLKDAKQQVVGRLNTYQELLDEPDPVADNATDA